MNNGISLITIKKQQEPYVKASELSKHLGYKEQDQVSKLIRRRQEDFTEVEAYVEDGVMYVNYDGAIKVCMFANTEKSREVREEITEVYKAWRNGEMYSSRELSQTEQALYLAKVVVKIAESQLELERKLEDHDVKIEKLQEQVKEISQNDSKGFITDDEASQISILVKMVAQSWGARENKNMFPAVYDLMYRKFAITSYKIIPKDKYAQVLEWLQNMHSSKAL